LAPTRAKLVKNGRKAVLQDLLAPTGDKSVAIGRKAMLKDLSLVLGLRVQRSAIGCPIEALSPQSLGFRICEGGDNVPPRGSSWDELCPSGEVFSIPALYIRVLGCAEKVIFHYTLNYLEREKTISREKLYFPLNLSSNSL